MNIGVLSGLTETSVRSIRHYEKSGLIRARRGDNGYRHFDAESVRQVRQIRRLLALGFSLEEIAAFPACMLLGEGEPLCPQAAQAHRRKLSAIEQQITDLEKQRARLVRTLRDSTPSSVPKT